MFVQILEMGGMQTLIWLCSTHSPQLYTHLIPAIHILATQVNLQKYLLQAGIVQALTRYVICAALQVLCIVTAQGAPTMAITSTKQNVCDSRPHWTFACFWAN